MRIIVPSYTQTPNDLFDHWLPLLGEVELKVLLIIMRKTFGFHKTRDFISITQLEKLTGSNQTNVIRATKSLESKGLITRNVEGPAGKQITYYELVVHDDSNNCYPSQIERGDQPPPLPNWEGYPSQIGRGTPPNLGGTKESLKENKTIVCSVAAPPVAAPPMIKKIEIKTFDNKNIFLTMEDLLTLSIQHRKDWVDSEIKELWKILENYNSPVRDLIKFCEGTIENIRKTNISNKLKEKVNKWTMTKQTSDGTKHSSKQYSNSSANITMKDMSEHPFQNWESMVGLPTLSRNT